jgi:hypothetical protein
VLDSQALSRLSRSHPEILRRIREVAHARTAARETEQRDERKGKARVASAQRRKQAASETL